MTRLRIRVRRYLRLGVAVAALALVGACGDNGRTGDGGDFVYGDEPDSTHPTVAATSALTAPEPVSSATASNNPTLAVSPTPTGVLSTAQAAMGTILVDKAGMTIYFYTKDAIGVSNCTAACLSAWPAVPAPASLPTSLPGITATLGQITRTDDGTSQLTVNGLPVYTYAVDTAPGQTLGQGVGGVWFVISSSGTAIMA